jgi:hypothetical protein
MISNSAFSEILTSMIKIDARPNISTPLGGGRRGRVVTLDVFRENHVRKMLFGCPRVWTNVRVGRPLADGMGGRPVGWPWWMAPSEQPLADGRGRQPGGRPWWMRRWKTLKRRPSICFSTSYPLWHTSRNPPLDSKVNVLILGAQGHECFYGECF